MVENVLKQNNTLDLEEMYFEVPAKKYGLMNYVQILKWFEIQDVEPAMDVHKKMVLDIKYVVLLACCKIAPLL